MRTKICDMLEIRYPIIQGAMGWIATEECIAHKNFKNAIIDARDDSTTVIGKDTLPARVIKNDFSTKMETIFDMDGVRSVLMDGDIKDGVMLCGQTAGMIKEIKKG